MTTSKETDWMDHPTIRRLADEAKALKVEERITLLKGLITLVAAEITPKAFEALADELRLKGERFYDAKGHPGTGRAERTVKGEREIEGR
jgi:hypothetical protein